MIVKTMSFKEVLKQLQRDYEYAEERRSGLRIKNSKKLKNKLVKDRSVMSQSKYVVPATNDTIVVCTIKAIQTLKNREYTSMGMTLYVKTCYGTYIIPNVVDNRAVGYLEVTNHAVQRLKERLGKDYDTFFKEDYIGKNDCILYPVQYNHNGDENEYIAHIGDAFLILEYEEGGNKRIVKTILSTKDLYACQMINKLNSKMKGDAFHAECRDAMAAEYEENLKLYIQMGIVRVVA